MAKARTEPDVARYADMFAAMGRSRGCGSCGCCCRRIPTAWSSARSDRTGDSELDALASSGQAEERGPGEVQPGRHIPPVLGEHGGVAGTAWASCTPSAARATRRSSRRGNRSVLQVGARNENNDGTSRKSSKRNTGRRRCASPRRAERCCGAAPVEWRAAIRSPRICTTPAQAGQMPEEAVLASLGCGNPTALAQAEAGRDGARSGLGRRHRRAAVGAARRPDGQGVRPGHDGRNAGAGAREQAQSRRRRTSNSSRARSSISRCPTIRWT